jgi:xanthine dehydrogenase YagR molybdenum-binding subunit
MSAVRVPTRAIGAPLDRLDGPAKVQGAATYAFEWPMERPAYLYPLQAEIATGASPSWRFCSPTRSPSAASWSAG